MFWLIILAYSKKVNYTGRAVTDWTDEIPPNSGKKGDWTE
jgi:hypothetical protein